MKKRKLGRGRRHLASFQVSFSGFRKKVENISANQRLGWPSCFPIGTNNIDFVEDIELDLPVEFRQIQFNSFREDVKNVLS